MSKQSLDDRLDLNDIREMVADIESCASDDEVAHIKENELYHLFVQFVASNGPRHLKEMALEILKTDDIDFYRWSA